MGCARVESAEHVDVHQKSTRHSDMRWLRELAQEINHGNGHARVKLAAEGMGRGKSGHRLFSGILAGKSHGWNQQVSGKINQFLCLTNYENRSPFIAKLGK